MTSLGDLPILPGETHPRPQPYHPAKWIPASEVRVGDLFVVGNPNRAADQEAGIAGGPTAPVTAVSDNGKSGQARRIFFAVAGANYYPNGARPTSKELVLR